LITFPLVHERALHRPLLYLSYYFKLHRAEYYDRLMAIRLNGNWEGWLKFFLRGVAQTASEAGSTAQEIFDLRERHRRLVLDRKLASNGLDLLALLYRRPLVTVSLVADELKISYQTANVLVGRLEDLGLLQETTGGRRGRVFRYEPYLKLFAEPTPSAPAGSDAVATSA
jgi:Fic family protein